MNESSYCSISSAAFGVVIVLDFRHSNRYVEVTHYCFITCPQAYAPHNAPRAQLLNGVLLPPSGDWAVTPWPGKGAERDRGEGGTGDSLVPGKLWETFPEDEALRPGPRKVVKRLQVGPAMRITWNQNDKCWLHIIIIITASIQKRCKSTLSLFQIIHEILRRKGKERGRGRGEEEEKGRERKDPRIS